MLYLALFIGHEEAVRVYRYESRSTPAFFFVEQPNREFDDFGAVVDWLKSAHRLTLQQVGCTMVCGCMSDDEFDALKILFPRVTVTRGHCYY